MNHIRELEIEAQRKQQKGYKQPQGVGDQCGLLPVLNVGSITQAGAKITMF